MAFAPEPWYPSYAAGASLWEVSALHDQQYAGLVMWSVGGLAPVVAGAVLLVAWLERLGRYPRSAQPPAA